jgi:hypothetical protein
MKLGFEASFVNLIMACVKSVNFFVKVNGKITVFCKPTRGIQQGDSISEYLFSFYVERDYLLCCSFRNSFYCKVVSRCPFSLLRTSEFSKVKSPRNNASISRGYEHRFWKKLWKVQASPEVRIFWWRVINNYMLVWDNFHWWHMETHNSCTDYYGQQTIRATRYIGQIFMTWWYN